MDLIRPGLRYVFRSKLWLHRREQWAGQVRSRSGRWSGYPAAASSSVGILAQAPKLKKSETETAETASSAKKAMTEAIEYIKYLPLYDELAKGATLPKGRQLTILWWSHLSKEAMLIDVGGNLYHLSREKKTEHYFSVIGTMREAEKLLPDGPLETLVKDDGGRPRDEDDAEAFPAEDQWLKLPVFAEIVVHLVTKTFHVRGRDEWNLLTNDQRAIADERNASLQGVPSPCVAFCLGADSLTDIHKLSTVRREVAKPPGRIIFQEKLSALGFPSSSMMGSVEWSFPDNDGNSQENLLGFAYAFSRLQGSSARVIFVGLEGPKEKMYYLGVTALGALEDEAVNLYNNSSMRACAAKQAAVEGLELSRELLQHKWWQVFSAPPFAPVAFPPEPDKAKEYILALTQFAQQKAAYPEDDGGQLHRKGCVCAWISDFKGQLKCGWCDIGVQYNGKKQFCDHINSRDHKKICDKATIAAAAAYQTSLSSECNNAMSSLHGPSRNLQK